MNKQKRQTYYLEIVFVIFTADTIKIESVIDVMFQGTAIASVKIILLIQVQFILRELK